MKIPITVRPAFWLVAALIGWLSSTSLAGMLIWMGAIFLSILVHEMGHALTARALGQRVEVELLFLGGVTRRGGASLRLSQEFLVIMNGPLAGFALYGATYVATFFLPPDTNELILTAFQALLFINLFWTLLNLLPVLPLDGGHLMRILLEGMFGPRGMKIALWLSMAFALLFGLLGFLAGFLLMGVLLMSFAFDSYSTVRKMKTLTSVDRDDSLIQEFQHAESAYQEGHRLEAFFLFQTLREKLKRGMLFLSATQYVALILEQEGRLEEAYQTLLNLEDPLPEEGIPIKHRLAYHNHDYTEVCILGDQAYQIAPDWKVAWMNAVAHAWQHDVSATLGWLRCAKREGMEPFAERITAAPEFAFLSSHPDYISITKN